MFSRQPYERSYKIKDKIKSIFITVIAKLGLKWLIEINFVRNKLTNLTIAIKNKAPIIYEVGSKEGRSSLR